MPDYGPLYQAAGEQWNISPLLLQSMANEESNEGRNTGPSSAGAKGFMQFLDKTAAQYGVDVNDTMSSIYGAANYMADLMAKHRGDTRAALAEYNGSNPNSDYVNKVMNRFTQLNQAWGVGPPRTNARVPPSTPNTFDEEARYAPNSPNQPPPPPPGEYRFAPVDEAAAAAPPPSDSEKPYTFAPQPEEEEGGHAVPGGAPPGTQYLSAATSPGALATGQPIAEGRVPGPGFQALINLPPKTPEGTIQKAQLAAQQLGIPIDRIIVGPEGRMVAVGDDGKPYFIEPYKVLSYSEPQTRSGPPGTPWEADPFHVNAYQVQPSFMPVPQSAAAASGGNMLRAGGALLPNAASDVLPMAAGTYAGGPLGGAAAAAATNAGVNMLRQGIANSFLPQSQGQSIFNSDIAKEAALTGAQWLLPTALLKAGQPGPANLLGARPFARPMELTRQQPFGLQDRIAPWEPPVRGELQPGEVVRWPRPEPGGPTTPIPGTHPAASPPLIDEIPQAEAAGIPRYKSPEQLAAEDRRIPQDVPLPTLPIRGEKGAEARAVQLLRHYAQGGNITPEEGATGTLSEITGNRGVAALERAMRDQAGPIANEIGQVIDANAAANRETLAGVRGSLDDLPGMRAAADNQTSGLYQRAFTPENIKSPADLTPTLNAVDRALHSPQAIGSPEISAALRDVRNRLFQRDPITGRPILDADGNPMLITDPEQAWGVRSGVGHGITSRSQSSNVDLRIAARQLGPVLQTLDNDITAAAPNYAGFNQAYQEARKPITAMEYLHGRTSLVDTTGTPTLRGVQATLDDIQKQRQLKSGWQPADDLSDQQIAQLEALRDQLRRQANVRNGMSIGPATFQKFATDRTMNLLTGPVGRTAVRAGIGAAGVHATGGPSGVLFGLAAPAIEAGMAQRQMIMRNRVNAHLTRLLLNRNGEGLAALRGSGPPTFP